MFDITLKVECRTIVIYICSLFVQITLLLEFRVIVIVSNYLMNLVKENSSHHYR